jgi:Ca2+-binding RTX toxin-like protein
MPQTDQGNCHDACAHQVFPSLVFLGIGDKLEFSWTIRNQGPDYSGDFAFSFRFDGGGADQFYDPGWRQSFGYNSDYCEWSTSQSGVVTVSCSNTSAVSVSATVVGNAPGILSPSPIVIGSLPDPDPSNNSVDWSTEVVCSITGTSGDDVLTGTEAVDSICGGDGNDHLTAVGMDDKLFGQEGNDLSTVLVGVRSA